ncbi:ribbon-helix-helix protein, CopG family [Sneathiella chinensis]|uniref:Ribbon-helix-helix protein CopG domain-containing protein n=1 Tax=Sneathiella chinensis TaxID=349750 RepID=A0ABQ5U140_9PROT|nr:hypothetical protein GCM10007924_10900 [Sneathiella chinensis]
MSLFAKKILFNISQFDLDRMTEMRVKRGLDQSEYIRRAIRMYVAEQKIEELRSDTKSGS